VGIMLRFCVIENDVVTNVVIADSKEIAEEITGLLCIQADHAGIGDIYDSEHGVVIQVLEIPEIVEEVPQPPEHVVEIIEEPTE
jgi:hypothetical protein